MPRPPKQLKRLPIGEFAFLACMAIAIIAGLFVGVGQLPTQVQAGISVMLVLLGAVVGLLNIAQREVISFLVAAIALLLVGAAGQAGGLGQLPYVGSLIQGILANIIAFVAPAALIVALKTVYDLAKK